MDTKNGDCNIMTKYLEYLISSSAIGKSGEETVKMFITLTRIEKIMETKITNLRYVSAYKDFHGVGMRYDRNTLQHLTYLKRCLASEGAWNVTLVELNDSFHPTVWIWDNQWGWVPEDKERITHYQFDMYKEDAQQAGDKINNEARETAHLIIDDANKQAGDIISKALHDSKDKRDEANEFYELRIKQANDDANYEINQAHKKAAKIVATADYYEAERKRGMHSAENDRYAAKVALEEAEKRAANIILDAKERSDVISDATDDTIDEILMDAQTKADHIIHDAKEKAKTIVDQGNETDSYHAKEAGRDADSTIQRAREQANTIVTNAKTEAEKLLEEFRTKGNKALDDARDEVADILNKAKLLSRISKKAPC